MPSARGSIGEPGTANTSRPCSSAKRAVISEPERCAASTMTTPSDRPEMIRLRRGKSRARGSQPSGISEIAAPSARIASSRPMCSRRIDAVVAAGQHRDGAGREARAMRGGVDAAREARGDDEAGFAEVARQPLGEFQPRRGGVARADHRDHRARRAPRDCRARRSAAAHRRSRRGAADSRARPARRRWRRTRRAASISRSASARGQTRIVAAAPPRRARSGRASSAARALPKWRSSDWNVRGPTLSLRISRSQSSRCSSVSARAPCLRADAPAFWPILPSVPLAAARCCRGA